MPDDNEDEAPEEIAPAPEVGAGVNVPQLVIEIELEPEIGTGGGVVVSTGRPPPAKVGLGPPEPE